MVVPVVPSGRQFWHTFGARRERWRRFTVAICGLLASLLFGGLVGRPLQVLLAYNFSLLPVLAPLFLAARRNADVRVAPYSAIFTGRISEIAIDDQIVVELEDEAMRVLQVSVPYSQRSVDTLRCGLEVALVIFSKNPSFSPIYAVTDVYIFESEEFLGSYPFLARDRFLQVLNACANIAEPST